MPPRALAALLAASLSAQQPAFALSQAAAPRSQPGAVPSAAAMAPPLAGPVFDFSVTASPLQPGPLSLDASLPAAPGFSPAADVAQVMGAADRALPRGSAASEAMGAADRALPRGSAASEAMGAAALPARSDASGALPGLMAAQQALAAPDRGARGLSSQVGEGRRVFDGALEMRDHTGPALVPAFEPPSLKPQEPEPAPSDEREGSGENESRRPSLSFQPAAKPALMATEPSKTINGAMKLVKKGPWSRDWWNAYRPGVEIDVVIRGEDVFGRPTTITSAVTKTISSLTREDFRGIVPEYQLQAGVRTLRKALVSSLEENRLRWGKPSDPPVTLDSRVRVIRFKSFLTLYREKHGKSAVPEPEAPSTRTPLKAAPEGPLKPLSLFLPRAVFLDLDLFDGPVPQALLSDIAKLQRTGVYFVAFSRKPYEAAGSLKSKLVSQLSAYQLSVLMPIRFLAVTDDGAVISELQRGGGVRPVDVLSFTRAEIDVLRDAAQKAAEASGIGPRSLTETRQPPLDDHRGDAFLERMRQTAASGKDAQSRYEAATPYERAPDPLVRFEIQFPKSVPADRQAAWEAAFLRLLETQRLSVAPRSAALADGRRSFSVQKTDLPLSMDRLRKALGDKFGLYLNPGDALVLTADPALKAANPGSLDVGAITGLSGAELIENALGIMLGEHRDNREGDLAGSASRMAQFTRDRRRYLSEALIEQEQDEQNINFFSGHMVHAANDWLVWELQNGRRPSAAEYETHLRERWNAGLREFKPVGLPRGQTSEDWLNASVTRALSMYEIVLKSHDRGEILVGTEIPNFFMVKDYQRRSGALKRRYVLHTIFDLIALRPIPGKPGHMTLVIYDFKTGPAKTRPKLNKDIQVLTYALFANQKWVGQQFPVPYLAGGKSYKIDSVAIEFIYSRKVQPTDVDPWGLDGIRRRIINTLNRIHTSEQRLFGNLPKPPARKGRKPGTKKRR